MRYLFLLCTILSLSTSELSAQAQLSSKSKLFIYELKQGGGELPFGYAYSQSPSGEILVSAFIRNNDQLDEIQLDQIGVISGTIFSNIRTIKLPPSSFPALSRINGVEYLQIDIPVAVSMDSARRATNTEMVHSGTDLNRAYKGEGVIVGIVDYGFDYLHPTFFDHVNSNTRIKRVWEQKKFGTPPPAYGYGNELSDEFSIVSAARDITTESHGSHVGGIAAGNGFTTTVGHEDRYRGMAYESDLVFVSISPEQSQWFTPGMSDMVDAVNYIFDYADSESKPAVANISWGGVLGPKDGTALYAELMDSLTGPGRIVCQSAGNNAGSNTHFRKEFSASDTIGKTYLTFPNSLPEDRLWVDVWGEQGESFCIAFNLNTNCTNTADSTEFICVTDSTFTVDLVLNNDTCRILVTMDDSEYNGKPRVTLDITNETPRYLGISLKSNSGIVDMWQGYVSVDNHHYRGSFIKWNCADASSGDDNFSISDMASSAAIIAVGAYNSKVRYQNVSGQNQTYPGYILSDRANFSSIGPSIDGRTKPDIVGPGLGIASAINSYETDYDPGNGRYPTVVDRFYSNIAGRDQSYAVSQGTSMSSPAVAGIVALLLEANPNLDPQTVIQILKETAIVDSFTGTVPNPEWGNGKIDAHAGIKKVLESVSINDLFADQEPVLLYPNPGKDFFQFNTEDESELSYEILSIDGKVISTGEVQNRDEKIFVGDLPSSNYLIRLSNGDSFITKKFLKVD